jgi:carbonic anhydrase
MPCLCSIHANAPPTDDDLKIYFSPLNLNSDDKSLIKTSDRKLQYNHDEAVKYAFYEDPTYVNSRIFNTDNKEPIYFKVNQQKFKLIEFHFHDHGENIINNDRQDMEVHFVFADDANPSDLAVLAFIFKENTKKHAESTKMIRRIRKNKKFDIPKISKYFTFSGALTKPPGYAVPQVAVAWHVSTEYLDISSDDLAYFRKTFCRQSADVQPRNGRNIALIKAK